MKFSEQFLTSTLFSLLLSSLSHAAPRREPNRIPVIDNYEFRHMRPPVITNSNTSSAANWLPLDRDCDAVPTGLRRPTKSSFKHILTDSDFDDSRPAGPWVYKGLSLRRCPEHEYVSLARGNLPWDQMRCECTVTEHDLKAVPKLPHVAWRFDLRLWGFGSGFQGKNECGNAIQHWLYQQPKVLNRLHIGGKWDYRDWKCTEDGAHGLHISWTAPKYLGWKAANRALWMASAMQMGGCTCGSNRAADSLLTMLWFGKVRSLSPKQIEAERTRNGTVFFTPSTDGNATISEIRGARDQVDNPRKPHPGKVRQHKLKKEDKVWEWKKERERKKESQREMLEREKEAAKALKAGHGKEGGGA